MKEKKYRQSRSGFTMVEILVVVVIIGLLAVMIVPTLFEHVITTRQNVAKANIATIESTIETFRLQYDRLPQNLRELVERPADIPEEEWKYPSLKAKNLNDPWKQEYVYKQPGDHGPFDLYSLGRDGQEGGEGENADICNWE